jgi:hypothetical protein
MTMTGMISKGGKMDNIQLVGVIQTVVFLLPVLGLVWKASQLSARVTENTKDIDGVGSKLNRWQDKMEQKLEEIDASINSLNLTMGRIEVRLTAIFDQKEKK